MKFQCEKYVLDNAAAIAARAAAAKSPVAALEGLFLQASLGGEDGSGVLRITGYDLKKGIFADIPADVSEAGGLVLPAKMFGDIVRKLPDGIVTLTADKNYKTHISCAKADYDIMGSDPEDYPELPDVEDHTIDLEMKQELLGRMIRQTLFAASDNESRPIYTGALMECNEGRLTMVTLDGYRLAIRRENAESCSAESCSVIVPGTALSEVEKLCTSEEGNVRMSVGRKHVCFRLNGVTLISRKLEGEFLNYHKAVPTEFSIRLKAQRTDMIRCAERVSLIIDDRSKNPLHCLFGNGSLNISSATALGRAEDNCPTEGDGKDTLIGLNNSYFLQALKAAPADRLLVNINNGNSPCVFLPEDGNDSFAYMILPVRLRAEG